MGFGDGFKGIYSYSTMRREGEWARAFVESGNNPNAQNNYFRKFLVPADKGGYR